MSQHPATRLVQLVLTSRWLPGMLMALGAAFGAVVRLPQGMVECIRSGAGGKTAEKEDPCPDSKGA